MGWITDLLKYLAVSKTIVAAIFITCSIMIFGSKNFPEFIPLIPVPWQSPVFALMVLTGVLLVLWLFQAIGAAIFTKYRDMPKKKIRAPLLTSNHFSLLLAASKDPHEALNIGYLDYEKSSISKLEVVQLASDLQQNGFVRVNPWDQNLVTLTESGIKKALEIKSAESGST